MECKNHYVLFFKHMKYLFGQTSRKFQNHVYKDILFIISDIAKTYELDEETIMKKYFKIKKNGDLVLDIETVDSSTLKNILKDKEEEFSIITNLEQLELDDPDDEKMVLSQLDVKRLLRTAKKKPPSRTKKPSKSSEKKKMITNLGEEDNDNQIVEMKVFKGKNIFVNMNTGIIYDENNEQIGTREEPEFAEVFN